MAIGCGGQAPLVISQQGLYLLALGPYSRPEVLKFIPLAKKQTKSGTAQGHLVYQVSQSHFLSNPKSEVCGLCLKPETFPVGLRAGFENEVTTKLRFSDFPVKSSSITGQCNI